MSSLCAHGFLLDLWVGWQNYSLSGGFRHRQSDTTLELNNVLGVELSKEVDHVGADLILRGKHELLLEFLNDFLDRELAGTKFKDDATRALYLDGTFGNQHDGSFRCASPATPRR